MAAGTMLDSDQLRALERAGIQEVWVVKADEALPSATVPEYMDRYGPDFPAHLQRVFTGTLVNRSMQRLFLSALGHATSCYRRYRVDPDREQP